MPMPPQATGAVLAIRQSKAAWNGWNPSPTRNAAEIATGCPEAGGPLDERPEAEGDQHRLEPPVGRKPGDRRLHHLELPGRDRDIVEEDRRHDQPDDPEQREDHADRRAGQRSSSAGIPKTSHATTQAVSRPASAACQRTDPPRGQQSQKHQDRQGRQTASKPASFRTGHNVESTRAASISSCHAAKLHSTAQVPGSAKSSAPMRVRAYE